MAKKKMRVGIHDQKTNQVHFVGSAAKVSDVRIGDEIPDLQDTVASIENAGNIVHIVTANSGAKYRLTAVQIVR